MKLHKHFHIIGPHKVARKLFLCRQCNKTCIPSDFRPYMKEKGNPVQIATSYTCNNCAKKFVTNEVLNKQRKLTIRDNYNSLTDN